MAEGRWVTIRGHHVLLKYDDGRFDNYNHSFGGGSSNNDNLKKLSELTKSVVNKLDAKVGDVQVSLSNSNNPEPNKYFDEYVLNNSDIGIGGGYRGLDRYLSASGHNDFVVQDAKGLLRLHGGTNWHSIDPQIIEHLRTNDDIGKVFKSIIKFEDASYKEWLLRHNNPDTAYKFNIFNGEKRIYRKGDRKTGVEPWTSKEEGADMGYGGIGYDHMSTVEQQLREGYHIIGGISSHWGSPGDAEITFVKW